MIKKSRFVAHVAPVASSDDADAVIARVKKQFWDASHNCAAQVTGAGADRARSSDDGEPSGTAGVPMLEVLRRRELTDVVAVVTRYFGGVKLGAGGLARAYSSVVSEALDHASIVDRRMLVQARISVSHGDAGRFDNLLRDWVRGHDAVLGEVSYLDCAEFDIWTPAEAMSTLAADISAASGGLVGVEQTGTQRLVGVPRV